MYFALGTLHHGATLCAEAKGIFVGMRPEIFAKLVEIRKANQIPATELTREQVTETVLAFCELFRPVPSIQDNLNVLESCSRYHFYQGIYALLSPSYMIPLSPASPALAEPL